MSLVRYLCAKTGIVSIMISIEKSEILQSK